MKIPLYDSLYAWIDDKIAILLSFSFGIKRGNTDLITNIEKRMGANGRT